MSKWNFKIIVETMEVAKTHKEKGSVDRKP
jgi:hypothetical protein